MTSEKNKQQNKNVCPDCGESMIILYSMDKKICGGCGYTTEFKLKKDQKSILIKNLIGD